MSRFLIIFNFCPCWKTKTFLSENTGKCKEWPIKFSKVTYHCSHTTNSRLCMRLQLWFRDLPILCESMACRKFCYFFNSRSRRLEQCSAVLLCPPKVMDYSLSNRGFFTFMCEACRPCACAPVLVRSRHGPTIFRTTRWTFSNYRYQTVTESRSCIKLFGIFGFPVS